MNASGKGVILAVVAYIVTMGVAIFIVAFGIMFVLILSLSCSAMGRALLTLWATIAIVCMASIAFVIVEVRKYVPDRTGRTTIVVAYGAAMLASYVFVAFGLMVLFNC